MRLSILSDSNSSGIKPGPIHPTLNSEDPVIGETTLKHILSWPTSVTQWNQITHASAPSLVFTSCRLT